MINREPIPMVNLVERYTSLRALSDLRSMGEIEQEARGADIFGDYTEALEMDAKRAAHSLSLTLPRHLDPAKPCGLLQDADTTDYRETAQ